MAASGAFGCDRTPASAPNEDGSKPSVAVPPAAPTPAPSSSPPVASATAPSSLGVSADGTLKLTAAPVHATHTHGGEEARIGHFRLIVKNTAARQRKLTLTRLEYRTGHSCSEPPTKVSARPKPQALIRDDDEDPRPLSTSATIPAKSEVKLKADFDSVGAYYTHCDQFGLFAVFSVDDKETLQLKVEIHVEREDPAP